MNIITDGWVTLSEHPQFNDFSNMSNEDKRIYHLIDELMLPSKLLIRIYQKEHNIVVAIRDVEWKFFKNRFFTHSKFETLCTVTPKRVYCSDVQRTGRLLCQHFGYQLKQHMTKPLLRKILKNGAEVCKELSEYVKPFPYGLHPEDVKIFTDNSRVFYERIGNNHELYDLYSQAKKLNKVIKMSWSDRKIHDKHMKWTEEIHRIKCRNCSEDPIWENVLALPENVELLNSERRIADEGLNMHHCIFTNYGHTLKSKSGIAFHVHSENPFTVMFSHMYDHSIKFSQAYHAWNKVLTDEEMAFAKSLQGFAEQMYESIKAETKEDDNPDFFN